MTLFSRYVSTPVGMLLLSVSEKGELAQALFREVAGKELQGPPEAQAGLKNAEEQLRAYFARELTQFSLSLGAQGTPFQQSVWKELCAIPYGETRSYGDIANKLGDPGAVRAVGKANGSNPIAIIVPCHRVIGANGSLTGYAGGLERKKWLLEFESQQTSLFG